jgi:hypothetical protein
MRPITDPTALRDQLDAASTDARRTLHEIAAVVAGPITPATPPPWLSGHLSALREALQQRRVRGCPHLATGPAVAYAAIWAPAILACAACAAYLLRPTPEEDRRCDRCRRTADVLHPGMVATGPILLAYGLCPTCRHHATPAPVPAVRADVTEPGSPAGRPARGSASRPRGGPTRRRDRAGRRRRHR